MNRYVEWKPFYSVGDPAIDDEHKNLLNVIDDLYVAVETGCGHVRARDVLERLAVHTMTHFAHEERVMREYGFPDFDTHKITHDEMRDRVYDLRAKPDEVVEHELLQFLKKWWISHIQNQDKAYTPYLHPASQQSVENIL